MKAFVYQVELQAAQTMVITPVMAVGEVTQQVHKPNSATGEESVESGGIDGSSYWTPRQLQLTMRFTF